MSRVPSSIVVGGGIAGATVARDLRTSSGGVVLLDRGRRLGGRMAVRTHDGHAVDLGASYLTVSDGRFEAQVQDWERRGLVRPWTDTFHTADADGLTSTKAGPVRWAATHGLRSLVEDLVDGVDVRRQEVSAVDADGRVDGEPTGITVLAMPDPQARRLLDALPDVTARLDRTWEPALALAARFERRSWPGLDGVFVNDHPVLEFVADDGRRRGDDAPVLVAHTTPGFASRHLDDPQAATPEVLGALRALLEVAAEPTWTHLQRWTYARPTDPRDEPFLLHHVPGLGVCGDGWHAPSKVEAAYLSGLELAAEIRGRDGTASA